MNQDSLTKPQMGPRGNNIINNVILLCESRVIDYQKRGGIILCTFMIVSDVGKLCNYVVGGGGVVMYHVEVGYTYMHVLSFCPSLFYCLLTS